MNNSTDWLEDDKAMVVQQLTPMEKAERYFKVVALKKRVEEEYKRLREELLQITKDAGVLSLKTEQYTISRVKRQTTKITDHQAAINSLTERNIPIVTKTVLDEDYMKPALEQLAESGEVIPGIETFDTEYVMVRQAKK